MTTTIKDIFGEPISIYTAEQAIEDGMLVEASPDTHKGWLFTAAVFEAITALPDLQGEPVYGLTYKQRVIPLLMDVAMIARQNPNENLYCGDALDGNLTGKPLWFGLNDVGGITVMFPEDY